MRRYFPGFIVTLAFLGLMSWPAFAQESRRPSSPSPSSTNQPGGLKEAEARKLARELNKLCEYKSIGVPTENGYNKKLSQSYDLHEIASVMGLRPNYEVKIYYNGDKIVVSRFFGVVKYNITFENRDGHSEFNLDTYNFKGYPSGSVAGGEKCATPSHLIRRKVHRMIDDLPLSPAQKAELKQNVRVAKEIKLNLIL